MAIKLAVLKSGEQIISDIKELISDERICGYLLKDPHRVGVRTPFSITDDEEDDEENFSDIEISLTPWIILTSDKEIPVSPDAILAIVEPVETLKKIYEEKVNGTDDQVSTSEE